MVQIFLRPDFKWTGQVVNLCEVAELIVHDVTRVEDNGGAHREGHGQSKEEGGLLESWTAVRSFGINEHTTVLNEKGINRTASLSRQMYIRSVAMRVFGGGKWKRRPKIKRKILNNVNKEKKLSCSDDHVSPKMKIMSLILCTCGLKHHHPSPPPTKGCETLRPYKIMKWDLAITPPSSIYEAEAVRVENMAMAPTIFSGLHRSVLKYGVSSLCVDSQV